MPSCLSKSLETHANLNRLHSFGILTLVQSVQVFGLSVGSIMIKILVMPLVDVGLRKNFNFRKVRLSSSTFFILGILT